MNSNSRIPLWKPDTVLREKSNLKKYMDWLFVKKGLYFSSYDELWRWSVTDIESFWESLWVYFSVRKGEAYTQVVTREKEDFIDVKWFQGATLNYAEHVFRNKDKKRPALWFSSERHELSAVSWDELEKQVSAIATWLRSIGVVPGDRVAGVLPNTPHAVAAFLATSAIGAVWSCCSPDFGNMAVIDRFNQIGPKVIFAVDGYSYNGKRFSKVEDISIIQGAIPSVKHVVMISYLDEQRSSSDFISWDDVLMMPSPLLEFEAVPFSHIVFFRDNREA
jgi:acetoacetyl-CoA synthetase